jgi:hypothetical protein
MKTENSPLKTIDTTKNKRKIFLKKKKKKIKNFTQKKILT